MPGPNEEKYTEDVFIVIVLVDTKQRKLKYTQTLFDVKHVFIMDFQLDFTKYNYLLKEYALTVL